MLRGFQSCNHRPQKNCRTMDNENQIEQRCAALRAQVAATESQLAQLKQELSSAEHAATTAKKRRDENSNGAGKTKWPLLDEEYKRYGRQMIVEEIGLKGWSTPLQYWLLTRADTRGKSRTTGTQIGEGLDCGYGWFGVSVSNVSSCGWSRDSWTGRRRCR